MDNGNKIIDSFIKTTKKFGQGSKISWSLPDPEEKELQ
jgi:hypothetical protein